MEGRDDKTKLMFSPRYSAHAGLGLPPTYGEENFNPPEKRNNMVIRIWGSTFKPALKKECLRLGVNVLDRVMATSLLNENGRQGSRIVGATGVNVRTGEFVIVKAKATIISAGGSGNMWFMDMEHGGYSSMYSRANSSDGTAMAWRAGAKLTMMEASSPYRIATGLKHKWYTGGGDASYENIPIVDSNGKVLPYATQGWQDGGAMWSDAAKMRAGIQSGEYELPFYADFAGIDPKESNATWNLMLNEESTTKIMVKTMTEGGFDYKRDQIMNYNMMEFQGSQQYREPGRGGLMTDWDLKTSLDGLYAAGTATFQPGDHSYAAATGRYAGRKAAAYAKGASAGKVSREQIDREKERVLAPTKRDSGIEWKELHNGLSRVMQYYVGEFKSERTLDLALEEIERIEKYAVPQLYALDPHKLMRSLEDLSLIEHAKIMIRAMKERKLSDPKLSLTRVDYPDSDAEDMKYYLALHQEGGEVKFERIPLRYWGNMKEQYEAHNPDYTGVYRPEK